uniref:DUF2177 family protein n=1 Tax=viral metagenome TaxID=1070528 RepID=A0A6C0BLF3_9ZZZZ
MSLLLNALKSGTLFTLFDALYLGVLRRQYHVDYFRQNINQGQPFHRRFLPLALLTWFLLGLGVELFANSPNVFEAALQGAALGFVIYGVYDLTNLATVDGWTPSFAIQDTLWGTLLTGTVAAISAWTRIN